MNLGIDTLTLRKRLGGNEAALRLLAAAGFDCADLTLDDMTEEHCVWNRDSYREAAAALRALADGLGLRFHQAHAPWTFDWTRDLWAREDAFQKTVRAIEIASIVGAKNIVVHVIQRGDYAAGYQREDFLTNLDWYRSLQPHAQRFGVRIGVENLHRTGTDGVRSPNVLSDPAQMTHMLDELGGENFVGCVDVGHAYLLGIDPAEMLRSLGRRVGMLHIQDTVRGEDCHMLPYFCGLDWDSVLRALAEIRYDGVFSLELPGFFEHFPAETLPDAVRLAEKTGRYLADRLERLREAQ
ncbi:MAG: sugar phosphate isomerase/epimerase [Oscillospiraceae bacterium]|nr:sugar phosphate isomerase/epimerase [Oscillospiraceae bacterium]